MPEKIILLFKVGYKWMETYDFTFFYTVFQSYQEDESLIKKGSVQWNPVYDLEYFALSGA